MRPRLTISLVLLLVNSSLFAQKPIPNQDPQKLTEDQKLLKDLRDNLMGDRKMLEKYFQKDFLNRIDGLFQDSIKAFGDEDFDAIRKSFEDSFQGLGTGLNNKWVKEKEGLVLLIDGAVAQEGSFDLKVKNGQVSIKGNLEKDLGTMGKRVMSFNRSFPVPVGTDGDKVRVENAKEGLRVVFPWKKGTTFEDNTPKKVPLKKDNGDLTI